MEPILSLLLAWALGAVVLMIVSRLGAGLSVEGFVPAFIAAAVITIVSWIFLWLFGIPGDRSGWSYLYPHLGRGLVKHNEL